MCCVNGGCTFEIEPDGRFAWSASEHRPPASHEYGDLRRNDGEIEFVPIRHPGEADHPLMTLKYGIIKWGDRLYLSSTADRDIQTICRAALASIGLMIDSSGTHSVYLRESDREKPQTGLPQLPAKVWVKFVLDRICHRDEDSRRELAIKSLLSRTSTNQQVPALDLSESPPAP